jgi:hypothetical protein
MVEEEIFVSQNLKVTCKNVENDKVKFKEAIHLIDKEKNPILYRYVSMNSTN